MGMVLNRYELRDGHPSCLSVRNVAIRKDGRASGWPFLIAR